MHLICKFVCGRTVLYRTHLEFLAYLQAFKPLSGETRSPVFRPAVASRPSPTLLYPRRQDLIHPASHHSSTPVSPFPLLPRDCGESSECVESSRVESSRLIRPSGKSLRRVSERRESRAAVSSVGEVRCLRLTRTNKSNYPYLSSCSPCLAIFLCLEYHNRHQLSLPAGWSKASFRLLSFEVRAALHWYSTLPQLAQSSPLVLLPLYSGSCSDAAV